MRQQRYRRFVAAVVLTAAAAGAPERLIGEPVPLPAITLSKVPGLRFETRHADFNADGLTDLIGNGATSSDGMAPLAVVLGAGNGTFGQPILTALNAHAMAVADFNADGRVDVVAQRHELYDPEAYSSVPELYLLFGNGDGTFGRPLTIAPMVATFAEVGDLNRDGRPDLVLGEEPASVHVLLGNVVGTFAAPTTIPVGDWPHGAVVADFNGDLFPDIAVAARYGQGTAPQINVLTSVAGMVFLRNDVPLEHRPTDAAAHDVNGDGLMDLVASARGAELVMPTEEGYAYVFLGAGLGTFHPPAIYEVERGAHEIIVGDFTRDGVVDIVTANRSVRYHDDCSYTTKDADSVSLLAGGGNGTFGRRTSFALGSQSVNGPSEEKERVASLSAAEVNGDSHPDLIVSEGRVLLNEAPRENRPPTVNAGDDQSFLGINDFMLLSETTDPDHHFLTFEWTVPGEEERSLFVPYACVGGFGYGRATFTLTVDDGHGGTATDAVTYTNIQPMSLSQPFAGEQVPAGLPYTITWEPPFPDPNLITFRVLLFDGMESKAICSDLDADARACEWPDPGPVTDSADITVEGLDAEGNLLSWGSVGGFSIVAPP